MSEKKKKFYKTKLFWFVIALLLIVLLGSSKAGLFGKSQIVYVTDIATRSDIEDSVLASGVLKPRNLVAVGARTTGRIIEFNVKPGSFVHKDQLIARIESTNQQNQLRKARAALEGLQSKLKQLKIQLQMSEQKLARSNKLLNSNAIMANSVTEAKAELETNRERKNELISEIHQAQLDIEMAKLALSYTEIKAPIDGTILACLVQKGQNINAVQSVPRVAIMGDVRHMKVYAQISEADIAKVHVGQEVYFNVIGEPEHIYHAKLEDLEPAPESIRDDINFNSSSRTGSGSAVYYNGIFTVDNADNNLKTYMNCEVHIVLSKDSNVIVIPSAALKNINGDKAQVMVKSGDIVLDRDVVVGLNNHVKAEIKSGIQPGEEVVVSVVDSSKVEAKKSSGGLTPPHGPMHRGRY